MARKDNGFYQGTPGVALSIPNTGGSNGDAATSIDATSPEFVQLPGWLWAIGFKCFSSVVNRFNWTTGFSNSTLCAGRFYYETGPATPTVAVQIASLRAAGPTAGQGGGLNHLSNGNITCVNTTGATVTGTVATGLPLNSCLRIETQAFSSATVGWMALQIYLENSMSAIFSGTSASNINTKGGNWTGLLVGNHSGGNWGYQPRFAQVSFVDTSATPLGPARAYPRGWGMAA